MRAASLDRRFPAMFALSLLALPALIFAPAATADIANLTAVKDNTLFEDAGGSPQIRIRLDESTPTAPTITVGDEVEIKTGSPDGVGGPPPPGLNSNTGDGQAYWRELRFGQDR